MRKFKIAILIMTISTIAVALFTAYALATSKLEIDEEHLHYAFSLCTVPQSTENYTEFETLDPWTLEAISNPGKLVDVPNANLTDWVLSNYTSYERANSLVFKYGDKFYRFSSLGKCDSSNRPWYDVLNGLYLFPAAPEMIGKYIGPSWIGIGVGWIGLIFAKLRNQRFKNK
ncbi:MAG: hypothetical protein QXZ02_05460 [Candidatus Bathyarchaeia archaeon]